MPTDKQRLDWLEKNGEKLFVETSTEDGKPLFAIETGEPNLPPLFGMSGPPLDGYSDYFESIREAIDYGINYESE